MKKKNIIIILVITAILAIITVNAIILEKELHNELIQYANKKYGASTCLSYVINDNNVEISLKDKDTGILYSIKCDNNNIDSTFDLNYITYIESKVNNKLNIISKKYNCTYIWSTGETLINIAMEKNNRCKTIAEKIAKVIRSEDIKQYFSGRKIKLKVDDKTVGIYDIYSKKYESSNNEYKELLMTAYDILKSSFNKDIDSSSKLKYIKSKKMYKTNIPGIDPSKIEIRIDDTSSNNKKVDVVYFDIGNEHWIVADCLIADGDEVHLFVTKLDE